MSISFYVQNSHILLKFLIFYLNLRKMQQKRGGNP